MGKERIIVGGKQIEGTAKSPFGNVPMASPRLSLVTNSFHTPMYRQLSFA
jgi:hypothetical protein